MTGKRFHTISLLVIVFGLLLFFTEFSRFSYVREITKFVNTLIAPFLEFKDQTIRELQEELRAYLHFVDTEKENIKLRRRLNSLMLTEKELQACLAELENLGRQMNVSSHFEKLSYKVSRIIYYDPSGFDLFVVIEGGKDKGFKEGDLVVTESYVVGVVETVFTSTSRVITPFNENFSCTAVVGTSLRKYIYRGGYPLGNLLHVKLEDKVEVGSEVFMVDVRGKLPPFLIGKIEEVKRGKDPFFKEVKVKPKVDPRSEELVYIIRRSP
ncbi:MAG: rod shape-determining protein MreC [Aquificae bacterium]|nr:rod shape-determining protein MreC [Aquificota bacterium]